MFNVQTYIDGLSAQWQKERADTQMTLGKLIDRLAAMPPDAQVCKLSCPHSYRGYYTDLAFEPTTDHMTVADALVTCRAAMGEVLIGYKGGEFQMGRNTPVWIAEYGHCGKTFLAIRDDGTLELAEDN
jgi:hypothetical protein